jgi:hypothetical protein
MIQVSTQQHLQILKQRFPRQPSMDEGCYTQSSSTSNTSSSGSGNGAGNGSKFKMSAALTQAMVTAAMPLARPAPASAPGEKRESARQTRIPRCTHLKQPHVARAHW